MNLVVEELAEKLHKEFRAAFKSHFIGLRDEYPNLGHDHGWAACSNRGKNYFRRRASRWLAAERAKILAEFKTAVIKDPFFESPEENT